MIDDDRQNLPSASNWKRFELCPGSWALEQEARRLGQEAHKRSLAADRGERIHAALAGEQVELNETDRATVEFLRERALDQVNRIFGSKDIPSITERRLWLDYNGKKALSGRFDVCYFTEKLALVIDYKTGWREPDAAEQNAQLKVLAVLVGIALPTVEEIVAIQVSGPYGVTEARYTLESLSQAYREIIATLRAINDPRAEFNPSIAACTYCPANLICQATKDLVKPVVKAQVSALPDGGDRAARLLDECDLLERHIEAIRKYYHERLSEDPAFDLPGWGLAPGPQRREVVSWKAAKARLEEFVAAEELEQLANYSIPAVEKLIAKALKLKAKESSVKLAEILGELLTIKSGNLCLKRVKGEPKVAALEQ